MVTSTLRNSASLSPRHSLRWRLPLYISALIVFVLLMFLWAAYRTVETTLVRAGGERAQGAADQVASLIDAQQSLEQLRRLATDSDLRRYLQTRTDEAREALRKRLLSLPPGGRRRVELWDDAGSRVFEISLPSTTTAGMPASVLPPASRPSSSGLSALQAVDDVVFSDAVAEIRDEDPPAAQTATTGRLGYLVLRSIFGVNPPALITRLS